jgi:transcriptional regulator with XRE-family HTH domain
MTNMEKQSQKDASASSKIEKQNSTNSVWTPKALLKRLARSPESRAKFVESQISNGIAFQIRALRNRNQWSQPKLAEKIGTTQNQIYRLEKPATAKPTISTLKRIAAVFDVDLVVRFVPFSQGIAWASGTPFTDAGLSTASLAVPSFREEYGTVQPGFGSIQGNEGAQSQRQGPGCIPIAPAQKGVLADAAD